MRTAVIILLLTVQSGVATDFCVYCKDIAYISQLSSVMWVSTAVHITALLVLVVIIVQAQTGPDDVDMTTLENINVSFHGEGMVYAPFLDRFIFGKLMYQVYRYSTLQ